MVRFDDSIGLPLALKGHYHRTLPSYSENLQILLASENQIHLVFDPIHENETLDEVVLRLDALHSKNPLKRLYDFFNEFFLQQAQVCLRCFALKFLLLIVTVFEIEK